MLNLAHFGSTLFVKTKQVESMGKIYSGAANVTIWLGTSTDDTALAYQFIEMLARNYRDVIDELHDVPEPGSSDGTGRLINIING